MKKTKTTTYTSRPWLRRITARLAYKAREEWLARATLALSERFAAGSVTVPADVKVSCGFPGGGSPRRRIGECWARSRSAAKVNEVFISPVLAVPYMVLDVLGHELLHAVDDCKSGHGKDFTRNSKAVGYTGGKHSRAKDATVDYLNLLAKQLGQYPHGEVVLAPKQQKPSHGLHKCVCPTGCGVWYATAKTLEDVGELVCPSCGETTKAVERREKKTLVKALTRLGYLAQEEGHELLGGARSG